MAPLAIATSAATHTVRQSNTSSGSMTVTQTNAEPSIPFNIPSGTLRLRAEPAEERHIQWAEDVVDNEGIGKKSSKVCCIYHKPHPVGESSDESSSDSSSDSDSDDSEPDNSTARPAGRLGGSARDRHHHHHHGHGHDHDRGQEGGGEGKGKSKARRKRSPNAYEKMPKHGGAKPGTSRS